MKMEFREIQGLNCTVRYPVDFDEKKQYPVIFFLHGAGGRGPMPDMEVVKGSPFFLHTSKMPQFSFITVAPRCSTGNTWFDLFHCLKAMVYEVARYPYVDATRLYAMGNSMGGYGTWQLAMSIPEMFAAIVPICGGGMYWNAGRLVNVPVWAFHGALDTVVLPEESKKMVDKVNQCGGNARLTLYPEADHNAWTPTFKDPEVFRWLLSQVNKTAREIEDGFRDPKIYG